MSNFKSKIILITGCSSGFGYVTAKYLAERGYTVIPSVRKKSDLAKLPNTVLLDVTWSQLKINRFIDSVIKKYGRIDVLVNNAGYGHYAPLENFLK
ncbi:SDR family NAD(P)-dependent oxidoreductase [Candidatus Collierbacteria bacterium]|nr:SDR family NAD(P)-dependent oxidoreductase [Candidatus Collierbacteria bacterium]